MKKTFIPIIGVFAVAVAVGGVDLRQRPQAHETAAARTRAPTTRGLDPDAGEHTHGRHFNPDFKWGDLQRAIRQRKAIVRRTRALVNATPNNGWTALGPGNIGGRVLAVHIDPNNPSHLIIGAAGGGIWTSTDAGKSWTAVNDFMASLAVNALVDDPANGTIYAGTGEYDAGDGMLGAGLFESTDNGTTWTALPATNPLNNAAWYFTNALAINANGVILAATWRGVMRSTDGGQTWTQTYSGLASDVAFDPNHPDDAIIDASPLQFATNTSSSYVAYSTDAGKTWTKVQLVDGGTMTFTVNSPASVAGSYAVGAAQFNPDSANVTADLAEVTDSGGRISDGCNAPFANAGAIGGHIAVIERGSCTFTQKVDNAQNAGAVGVIIVDDKSEPVFTMGGTDSSITIPSFLISQNDGAKIENAMAGNTVNATLVLSTNSNGGSGRVRLAYAPSAASTIYAAADYQKGTLFKSTDDGRTWTQESVVRNSIEYLYDIGGGDQGGYDDPLWVDPNDANHLVAGGIDLWQSTDGGQSWTQISNWTNTPLTPHADHHALAAVGSDFYDGNDGGVYSTPNVSQATTTSGWTSLNNGLGVTQFYSVAGKASATSSKNGGKAPIIGGTQDNGCEVYTGYANGWIEYYGGDGGFTAVDPEDGNNLFCEYVYLDLNRSLNGGQSASDISSGITDVSNQAANFIAPFILDPNNDQTLLGGGSSLWRTTDALTATPTWLAINGSTLPSGNGDYINAIAVGQGDSDDIWVGFNGGSLWHTSDGTRTAPTWSQVGAGTLPSGHALNRIVMDADNRDSIYVMYQDFGSRTLWHSIDGGSTWTDISAGLPAAPVFDLAISPTNTHTLFAATEVGLFTSSDGGTTWGATNDGPANVRIVQLDQFAPTRLVAATHGRGMWELTLSAGSGVSLSSLGPAGVATGSSDFTLTANGSGFQNGAVVSFNGTVLATTFVSASQVKASVPATEVANSGTYDVVATNPDGTRSNAVSFTVSPPSSGGGQSGSGGSPGGGGSLGWLALAALLGLAWLGGRRQGWKARIAGLGTGG